MHFGLTAYSCSYQKDRVNELIKKVLGEIVIVNGITIVRGRIIASSHFLYETLLNLKKLFLTHQIFGGYMVKFYRVGK